MFFWPAGYVFFLLWKKKQCFADGNAEFQQAKRRKHTHVEAMRFFDGAEGLKISGAETLFRFKQQKKTWVLQENMKPAKAGGRKRTWDLHKPDILNRKPQNPGPKPCRSLCSLR